MNVYKASAEKVEGSTNTTLREWLHRLPGVQFFALFYFSTPTFDAVGEALNVFGIIGVLLFSLVLGMSTSLGYSDYEAANQRFSNTTAGVDYGKYMQMWYGNQLSYATPAISDSFVYDISISVCSTGLSVLLVVLVYFHLVFGKTAFESEDEEERRKL
jgi:hypothetical protein